MLRAKTHENIGASIHFLGSNSEDLYQGFMGSSGLLFLLSKILEIREWYHDIQGNWLAINISCIWHEETIIYVWFIIDIYILHNVIPTKTLLVVVVLCIEADLMLGNLFLLQKLSQHTNLFHATQRCVGSIKKHNIIQKKLLNHTYGISLFGLRDGQRFFFFLKKKKIG